MKKGFKPIGPVNWALLLAAIILLWSSSNMKWGDGRWNRIVKTDGTGYFSYLPAIFVYHDLTFSFHDSVAGHPEHSEFKYEYRTHYKGQPVNKYYAGTALMMMPFYLIGHLLNYLTGNPMDGFSVWVLIFIHIGAIFYTLLGMWWLSRILVTYQIKPLINAVVVFAVLFGTNLFYYVSEEPSMSHVYSFAMVSLFILAVNQYFLGAGVRWFFVAMVAFGMIVLIRPVNGLVLFSLPFLAGDWYTLKRGFTVLFQKSATLLAGMLLAGFIVGIQGLIYLMQTGEFFVYSYRDEGFNFANHHMVDFLFSYRKGFFVYTPMCMVALFGWWQVWKTSKFAAFGFAGFFILVVYLLSSWWQWYYGGSFSSRVMIEYLPFFMILLALLLQQFPRPKWMIGLVFLLIIFCQIQTYQYRYGYLHWQDMNKELYWDLFMRFNMNVICFPIIEGTQARVR